MKHHVAICSKRNNFEVPEISNNAQQTQMEQPETLKENASSTVAPATTPVTTATAPSDVKPDEREGATLCINTRTQILLQTARALASNPNTPHEIENVRVLFDSGPSRTYITSDLKEKLQLPVLGREQLLIKTFGSDDEELTISEIVKLSLKSLHDNVKISLSAYAVPVICLPIYNQPVEFAVQSYNHLKGLTLAEDLMQDSHAEINILLGSDQIWNFLNSQTIWGQSGPVAVSTKFGYVLSGPVNNVPFEEVITNFVTAHALKADAIEVTSQEILDNHMKHFYDLETLGICSKEVSVHEEFLGDIKFNGK